MKQKYRKIIYKIPAVYKLCKIAVDINNFMYFKFSSIGKSGNKKIRELKDSQQGKRCFIIGNGPSLRADDLDELVNEDCFGMNYIFKLFDQTKWRPKYYITQDKYGISVSQINNLNLKNLFIGSYYFRKNKPDNINAICFNHKSIRGKKEFKFSSECSNVIYDSGTVTYSALQLAAYMGYLKIYLLGMDTDFPNILTADGKVEIRQNKSSHFYNDSDPDNIIYSEYSILKGYTCAKEYCDVHNIKIYNATRGGKLEVFERIDFDSLFNNQEDKK